MAVNYRQILTLSETIFDSATSEVEYRAVVNRAYYAAFTCAAEDRNRRGISLDPNRGPHDRVWATLPRPIKERGKAFQKSREKSDYIYDESVSQSDAENAIAESKTIIEMIGKLSR